MEHVTPGVSLCFKTLLINASLSYSKHQALVTSTACFTYSELYTDASQLSRWLISRGVGPGVIVPIAFERSPDMIIAMLAIILAGGAYLPLDLDSPAARISDILTDSRATEMLSTQSIADNIAFPKHLTIHCIDTEVFKAATAMHDPTPPVGADLVRPLMQSDAPYVIYTSGTTGKPKGVVNTHAGVANSLQWMADELALGPDARCLLKAPYTFDLSVWEIFVPLSVGGCLVLAEPGAQRIPALIAETIQKHAVSLAYFVPTMLSELLHDDTIDPGTSLKDVVAIGEALTGTLQSRFHARLPHTRLWNSYGPTEAAVGVTLWLCRPEHGDEAPPLGYSAWNTGLYVLDEALQETPVGQSGEIYISGIQVATGYLEQPALTRSKFIPCPFEPKPSRMYRTGDFGIRRTDGQITFLGRQDGQLKFNGIRIELGEIETAIGSLAGVSRTVVAPRLVQGSTMLVAYLVMRDGVAGMTGSELSEALFGLLPGYMIPSLAVTLDELPLTTSGKLDMKRLPDPEVTHLVAYRTPRDGLESEIAALFSEFTGFAPVGADHSFFSLGGTSLMAMRLAGRLKTRTGYRLPMRALVECPTPSSLAGALEAPVPSSATAVQAVPVIMFPGAGGEDLPFARLSRSCAPALDLITLRYPDWRELRKGRFTFDDVAREMARQVNAVLPKPAVVRLAGYSLGGDMAFAVARILEGEGRTVAFLGLIDTDAPRNPAARPPAYSASQAVRGAFLDRLPAGLTAVVISAIGRLRTTADMEFRMNRRMMIERRRAWQATDLAREPLGQVRASTALFLCDDSRQSPDGFALWPSRCRDLHIVPVAGSHFTLLNPEHLPGFTAAFIANAVPAKLWTGTIPSTHGASQIQVPEPLHGSPIADLVDA